MDKDLTMVLGEFSLAQCLIYASTELNGRNSAVHSNIYYNKLMFMVTESKFNNYKINLTYNICEPTRGKGTPRGIW